MTTPEQQARELLDRMGLLDRWHRGAGDVVELANLIEERDRLRAGIEAALVEINHRAKRESAQWNDMVAKGLDEAAAIVRKHTGVTK
jgi:hypothetical protein